LTGILNIKMDLKQDDIIELTAEKLVYQGDTLAHFDGRAVFLEKAVPGDKVRARVLRVNKNFLRAKTIEVIEPSKYRTEAFCPLFNACGGCTAQNVEYNFLIEQKENILKEFFNDFKDIQFKPFIRAVNHREFRCKVCNVICETKVSKRILAGYYKKNSHDVVNIKYCPIQPQIIDEIVNFVRENWKLGAYTEKKNKGLLRHILVRYSSTGGGLILTLVLNSGEKEFARINAEIKAFSETAAKKFPCIKGVLVNFNPQKTNKITGDKTICVFGEDFIVQKLYSNNGIEYSFKISKDSFFQTNPEIASKIFDSVKDLIPKKAHILDAYGGVGAIGIFLSDKAEKITLVEECKSATDDAKENFKLNGCRNYEVFQGDAKDIFKSFLKGGANAVGKGFKGLGHTRKGEGKFFDCAILDPPRKGSDKEALNIISKLTKAIIYVSCNPSTLARDAKILETLGFRLKSIQGADMFPFTYHIESVAYFEKNEQ